MTTTSLNSLLNYLLLGYINVLILVEYRAGTQKLHLHILTYLDLKFKLGTYLAESWLIVQPGASVSVTTCSDFKVERTIDSVGNKIIEKHLSYDSFELTSHPSPIYLAND